MVLKLVAQLSGLVRGARAGSASSSSSDREFQRLYLSAFGFVRQRARYLLRDEEAALDAVQETFTRAWKNWPQVIGARSQLAWLMVTITRLCIDRQRRRRPDGVTVEEQAVGTPDNAHLAHLLRLRLGGEQPLRQQVVIHTWVDEMTQEETAALLGISRKTVQRQLEAFRAKHAHELAAMVEAPSGF